MEEIAAFVRSTVPTVKAGCSGRPVSSVDPRAKMARVGQKFPNTSDEKQSKRNSGRGTINALRGDMGLNLTKRQKEGICILDLRGRLVIGDSEAILRRVIVAMTRCGALNIVLNFAEVSEIDADGLGTLVSCYARLASLNGALKLMNLKPSHLNVMIAAKLAMFEVFSEEQDAVNSFFPDRAVRRYDILEWIQNRDMHPAPESSKQT